MGGKKMCNHESFSRKLFITKNERYRYNTSHSIYQGSTTRILLYIFFLFCQILDD